MNLEDKRLVYYTLKSKIRKKKLNYKEISKKMNISESGLNKKMNGKNFFTQSEIYELKELLELSNDELVQIFF